MKPPIHLGRCLFHNERYTRLEPLLTAGPNGWSVPDRRRAFPEVGKLFTFEKPFVGSPEGSVWLFRTAPNTQIRPGEEKDLYLAVDGEEPIEVHDLSAGGVEEARQSLVEAGLPSTSIGSPEIVAIVEPGRCVRLRLFLDDVTGRWYPESGDLERVPIFEFDPTCDAGADADGRRYVVPGREPGRILHCMDWSQDSDFLQKVLRRLRKSAVVQLGGDAHDLSNRAIERLVLAFNQAELLTGDATTADAMHRRLDVFLAKLRTNLAFARELASVLAGLPTIAQMLEEERGASRERLTIELRAELEPRIEAQLNAERSQVAAEVATIREEAVAHQSRLDSLRQEMGELASQRDFLKTELADDVTMIAEKLARASEIAGRLGLLRSSAPAVQSVPPPWSDRKQRAATLIAAGDLSQALQDAERSLGLPDSILSRLDSILQSGTIPLLFGPDAERALRAYSATVAAGNMGRMPLDAAVLGLDDLWHRAGSGSETTFARSWMAAIEDPQRSMLVVLDDLDVHHLATWVPRLAGIVATCDRPRNLMVAATAVLLPHGSLATEQLLEACIPFEIDGGIAAAAAAAVSETESLDHPLGLAPADEPLVPAELGRQLLSDLMVVEGLTSRDAARATRALRAALRTMSQAEALAFAQMIGSLGSTRRRNSTANFLEMSLQNFLRRLDRTTN